MKPIQKIGVALGLAFLSSLAQAQLTAIGTFSGAMSDDFESYPDYNDIGFAGYDTLAIMGGGATLTSNPSGSKQNWIWDDVTATWGLGSSGAALTHSGHQALGLYLSGAPVNTGITFSGTVAKWGTWFAADNAADMTIAFYDGSGGQIGATQHVTSADNNMVWIGWSSTVAIKSIAFGGDVTAPVMDDMQADPVPEPASMAVFGLAALALRKRRKS